MKRENRRQTVFTRRALLLMGGQVAILGGLGARLYQMQVIDAAQYRTKARDNRISARLIAPPRGRILDRFDQVLAGNRPNWRALLIAEQTDNIPATLARLASIIPLSEAEQARVIQEAHRNRRFIPVLVRDFLTWDEMARIEVAAPDLPGILVDVGSTREYPFSDQLAHVVGYVAPPNQQEVGSDPLLALPGMRVGRAGVEKQHDLELRGQAGVVQLEVNAFGRVIRELERQDGVQGAEVGLTIDATLQQSVIGHLGDQSASALVLDCTNGEVLAMATQPSFDPSLFNSGVSEAQWHAWISNERAPLINKATTGLYAPGSTFKVAVALAGLTSGAIKPTDKIFCPGYIDIGTSRFHCWKLGGHGLLDVRGGLKNSCDVFFYETARRTGIDTIAAMAHRLGLGVKPDIDLPGVRTGMIPTREWRIAQGHPWNIGDTVVAGIGQGYIVVTPLELATYVARIASGRVVSPHVTRRVGDVIQPGGRAEEWPVLDVPMRYLDLVREGMWEVVNAPGGTAPLARLPDPHVQLAGKTGSAQVMRVSRALRESGHFNSANLPWKERPNALFIAFAPYDAPRYAVAVVVEHGNAGADVAGPIARDIMEDTLARDPARRSTAPGSPGVAGAPAGGVAETPG